VKQLRSEADHSSPSNAVVKNAKSYSPLHSIRVHGMILSEAQGHLYLKFTFKREKFAEGWSSLNV
jgi:hypothetical protein